MAANKDNDDFTPQEKQDRFLATIRGALKTPPLPKPGKQPARGIPAGLGMADTEIRTIRDARPFREASEELERIFRVSLQPEFATEIAEFISDKFIQFVEIVLQPAIADDIGASEQRITLKPSNFFLRLLAASRTNDEHQVRRVYHEIRSLVGVVTSG